MFSGDSTELKSMEPSNALMETQQYVNFPGGIPPDDSYRVQIHSIVVSQIKSNWFTMKENQNEPDFYVFD